MKTKTVKTLSLVEHYTKNLKWGLVKLGDGKRPTVDNWPNLPITDSSVSGNIGLNHGYSSTATLDIDHMSAEYALSLVGVDLAAVLAAAPYKIIGDPDNPPKPLYRIPPGVELKVKRLTWPDPSGQLNDNGKPKLITIFELRGGPGSQDVLPPSIHPDTKQPYVWTDGPPERLVDIPLIPSVLLALWQNWADQAKRFVCPWVELPPTPAAKRNGAYNAGFDVSVVQREFNALYTPGDILERNGYRPKGNKWLCPNSSSGNPGVILLNDGDKVMSFHGSDLLGDGHPHDAYDIFTILEHNGDRSTAWNTAREALNIDIGQQAAQLVKENEAARAKEDNPLLFQDDDDEGNAQCVYHLYGSSFVQTDAAGWLSYTGTHWSAAGSEADLNRAIVETLKGRRILAVKADNEKKIRTFKPSAANVRNCKYLFQSLVWDSLDNFDNDPDLINCSNGVVNLQTGELTPHDHSQRFTYCIDTPYDPQADYSKWDEWLYSTVLPEGADDDGQYVDLCAWLQMAVGYTLTGHTHEQCLFYLQGPPRAGKGVFCQTLDRLLGSILAKGVDFDTFTGKRSGDSQNFDLAPLKPCRMVSASESDRSSMLNAKKVKSITGNDPIYCSHKHKSFFSYTPQFKIWLSSNFGVMAQADDDALWSRLRIINFPNSHLGKEDFGLEARLWEHRTGILKWAVDGAIEWYQRKAQNIGLGRPGLITAAVEAHRKENDTVGQFIDDCCTTGPDQYTTGIHFSASYRSWCKESGLTALGARRLTESMHRKGFEYKQKWIEGKNCKSWIGINII